MTAARRFPTDEAGRGWARLGTHEDEPSGEDSAHGPDHDCVEWCPICRTADLLRSGAPEELRDQWQDLQRETLLTLRAVLDHYLGRLDERSRGESRVEEIPID